MISEYTINTVKEQAKVSEVVGDFLKLTKRGSDYVCKCPFHEEKSASFCIKESENFYKCFGCGASGDAVEFIVKHKNISYQEAIKYLCDKYKVVYETENDEPQKAYTKPPAFKNTTQLNDKVVKWFADKRKISQATLLKLQITDGISWMPEGKNKDAKVPAGERHTIQFNYIRNGERINVKFRDAFKTFLLYKDAELILYNMDSLKKATVCYWLEGEPDCATLIEAGIMREGVAVISVPNGATKTTNNLKYIDNCIADLDHIKLHILGFDNDINGRKLREDVAERLGKEKCKYIEWKDKKDANEVLVAYDINAVIECCSNKKDFPIEGAFGMGAFKNSLNDFFTNGVDRGVGIGKKSFDELLRFVTGHITLVTGYPNHGKGEWVDEMCMRLLILHGWKGAYFSPENYPTEFHIARLIRKVIGKNLYGRNKLNDAEKTSAFNYLDGKLFYVMPERDFTLKSVLTKIERLIQQHGIKWFVIDPYNKIETKYSHNNDVRYLTDTLNELDAFCKRHNVLCYLVAHPTKAEVDKKTGKLPVVTMNNISGGGQFNNIVSNGISVYRDFGKFNEEIGKYDNQTTIIYVQKVKMQPFWGHQGYAKFKYDIESSRYNEYKIDPNFTYTEDKSNWIIEKQVQSTMQMPEPIIEAPEGIITNSHITDDPF